MNPKTEQDDTDTESDCWHVRRTLSFYRAGRSKIARSDIQKMFDWIREQDIRLMDPNPNIDEWFFMLLETADQNDLRGICERAKAAGVLPRLSIVLADLTGGYDAKGSKGGQKPKRDSAETPRQEGGDSDLDSGSGAGVS